MKPRNNKGRLAPFVPLTKETMKTEAWKALSHGARSLYSVLKGRYNTKLQGAVYVSSRLAQEELGRHSHRTKILSWYRELEYYGFIRMVSLPHHGLNGHGRAAHYRLTEEWYLGEKPTRDFLHWNGEVFHEQKSPSHYQRKNRNRGTDGCTTLVQTGVPVTAQSEPETAESGTDACTMYRDGGGTNGRTITSLTTPCLSSGASVDPTAILEPASSIIPDVAPNNLVSNWTTPQLTQMQWDDSWFLVYLRLSKTGEGVVSNKAA
jgi:hypothetical protein